MKKPYDIDVLGNLIKHYEGLCESNLSPGCPVIVRLDGNNFHKFTKDLKKPFDNDLTTCMVNTTKKLVKFFNADLGYTQSDEITIIFKNEIKFENNNFTNLNFSGRLQKLCSLMAAKCAVVFNKELEIHLPAKTVAAPIFDARVFSVPTLEIAKMVVHWRELDASKNAVSMAAHAYISHKKLQGVNHHDKIAMLLETGIDFYHYDPKFRRGVQILPKMVMTALTKEQLAKIPEVHRQAKLNEVVERTHHFVVTLPVLSQIFNLNDVLFNKEQLVIHYGIGEGILQDISFFNLGN